MVSIIPTIAVKISVCANPLLYIAYNPKLRKPYETNEYSSDKDVENASDFYMPSLKTVLKEIQKENVPLDNEKELTPLDSL